MEWKARWGLGPKVYTAAPDGGWGWVVAVSFFVVEVFTYGVIKSFGVFLQDLMSEFGETNNRISWIVSISVFVMTFTAPLSSVMSNRFGFRPVVMIGGLLISLGTITTGFAKSVNQMYLTTGIVSGLGYCLTFLPTVTILSQYFDKRRSLVTAFASTGECISIFTLAPALTALKERIGWRLCLVVVGVLQASVIVCGALLRPIIIQPTQEEEGEEEEEKEGGANAPPKNHPDAAYTLENEDTRISLDSGVQSLSASRSDLAPEGPAGGHGRPPLLDLSVLRDWGFVCYALFGLFATLGFFAPQLYVIDLSVSRGVARETAAYMLSAMAVAEVVGRLSAGVVMSRPRVHKIHVLLACVALLAAVLALFTAATGFWGLAVCCALYGFLLGTVCSTHIPMLAEDDVVGIRRMSSAAGIYVFIQSFACLGGPPLGGILVDVTKNYGSAFYSCAAGMAVGALFLSLVRPVKAGRCCGSRPGRRQEGEEQAAALRPNQEEPVDFLEVDVATETDQEKQQAEGEV